MRFKTCNTGYFNQIYCYFNAVFPLNSNFTVLIVYLNIKVYFTTDIYSINSVQHFLTLRFSGLLWRVLNIHLFFFLSRLKLQNMLKRRTVLNNIIVLTYFYDIMIIEYDRDNLMIKYIVISFMQHQLSDDPLIAARKI